MDVLEGGLLGGVPAKTLRAITYWLTLTAMTCVYVGYVGYADMSYNILSDNDDMKRFDVVKMFPTFTTTECVMKCYDDVDCDNPGLKENEVMNYSK